jgi:hypothetical protein
MKVLICLVKFKVTLGNALAGTPFRPSSGVPVCKKRSPHELIYRIRILSPPERAPDLQKSKYLNIYSAAGQDFGPTV